MTKWFLSLLLLSFISCDNEKAKTQPDDLDLNYKFKYEQLSNSIVSSYFYEGNHLKNVSIGDKQMLSDAFHSKTVIFRFSELHCKECIDQVLDNLNIYFNEKENKVLLLADFQSIRKLEIYLSKKGLGKFNYTILKNQDENWPIEKAFAPYLFITDKELRIDNLLLPHYSTPEITEGYLSLISKKF